MAGRTGLGGLGGLSAGLRTFVVVDLVLVITFLVLLVMQLASGGGQAPGPSDPASASAAVEATPDVTAPDTPTDAQTLSAFVLPSGNIWCEMTETSATCTILQFTFTAPQVPAGCTGSVGNVLTVTGGEQASMPCVTGAPPAVPAEAPVLEYGQASTVGEMTCHSSTNGATCRHNPTGAGFAVARGGFTLF